MQQIFLINIFPQEIINIQPNGKKKFRSILDIPDPTETNFSYQNRP